MKITTRGFDEYIATLRRVSDHTEGVCTKVVYEGAGSAAESLKKGVQRVPTGAFTWGTRAAKVSHITPTQQGDMLKSIGIARFGKGGGKIDTSVGIHGYNSIQTKKYPKGQPNILLARSITSGTSFREKNPCIRQSVKGASRPARQKMKTVFETEIAKLTR